MASEKMQQGLVLGMSTMAFTICFMIWMMFAVLGVVVVFRPDGLLRGPVAG